jgi:hypothetical protein
MISKIYAISKPQSLEQSFQSVPLRQLQAVTAGTDRKAFSAEMLPYVYLRASVLSITRLHSFSLVYLAAVSSSKEASQLAHGYGR